MLRLREEEHICLSIETENITTVLKEGAVKDSIKDTDAVVFMIDNLCLIWILWLF